MVVPADKKTACTPLRFLSLQPTTNKSLRQNFHGGVIFRSLKDIMHILGFVSDGFYIIHPRPAIVSPRARAMSMVHLTI